MDNTNTKEIVIRFIDKIWNSNKFDEIDDYLHTDFTDNSLPPNLPATKEGTIQWIIGTSASFEHHTTIQEQVTEGDKSMIKFRLDLKHIGKWRGIAPTNTFLSVVGYRYFRLSDGKIIDHFALIDGNAIENQLNDAAHGCKVQV